MSNKSYSLSRLEVSGSPFEVGLQLGRFGKEAVHSYLLGSAAWGTVQTWKGSAAAQRMAVALLPF